MFVSNPEVMTAGRKELEAKKSIHGRFGLLHLDFEHGISSSEVAERRERLIFEFRLKTSPVLAFLRSYYPLGQA